MVEADMISWQGYVLLLYLRMNWYLSTRTGKLNIENDRRYLDRMGNFFRPLITILHTPVTVNDIPGEWIVPEGLSTGRVILYFHGGGFNSGSIESHRALAGNIASICKARVLIIDYRLAPEHPYPCGLQDCLTAYEWLLASGITNDQIAIMGDSAGGNLTLALLVQLRDLGKPLPRLAVCLSPATDLTMSGESWKPKVSKDYMLDPTNIHTCIEIYLREADPHLPLISPLYADLHGLPPMLIQIGSDEALLSDATRFAQKAKEAGVPVRLEIWEGMQHVWQFAARYLPEGRQAIEKIGEFTERLYSIKPVLAQASW
jgi:acetyl esterase/lipase